MLKKVDVVLIALSSPIQIGIYEDEKLIDIISSEKKSSDILPVIFDTLFKKYDIKRVVYANGPGSFMAIKVSYIFLKSISILKNIPLFATDAFYFNNNKPIKAIGKLYFVKVSSEIKTQKIDSIPEMNFTLPDNINFDEFSDISTPLYCIGAVG